MSVSTFCRKIVLNIDIVEQGFRGSWEQVPIVGQGLALAENRNIIANFSARASPRPTSA